MMDEIRRPSKKTIRGKLALAVLLAAGAQRQADDAAERIRYKAGNERAPHCA
jgi:hypothetical protein